MLQSKQLVLAKIKGFPDWPAIIVPKENIPSKLSTSKYEKLLLNYLNPNITSNDQIVVKFYYDDQYSWTKVSNIKPLNDQIVNDYLLSVGELNNDNIIDNNDDNDNNINAPKRGGRKKRITEAYLKVKEVPIDEFLEWGSWGKPITPEPEPEPESDFINDNDNNKDSNNSLKRSANDDLKNNNQIKKQRKKPGPKPGSKRKVEKPSSSKTSNRKAGRAGKKNKISEEFADEEFIELIDNENDDDYLSNYEESPELEESEEYEEGEGETEMEEAEEAEEEGEEGEEGEEEEDNDELTINQPLIDELSLKKPKDFNANFNEIPSNDAFIKEVAEMTVWCKDLRLQLQALIFPLKAQKQGEIQEEKKENNDKKEENVKKEGSENENENENQNDVKKEKEDKEDEEDKEVKESQEDDEQSHTSENLDRVINYTKLASSIESLVSPLLNADLSKSILKSTGLMNIIYIILSKPEFQINTSISNKLNKWWVKNFGFKVVPDNHWSDDFTIAMHLEDEVMRKAKEEEKRRKKKEERRTQSLAATPEVEESKVTV